MGYNLYKILLFSQFIHCESASFNAVETTSKLIVLKKKRGRKMFEYLIGKEQEKWRCFTSFMLRKDISFLTKIIEGLIMATILLLSTFVDVVLFILIICFGIIETCISFWCGLWLFCLIFGSIMQFGFNGPEFWFISKGTETVILEVIIYLLALVIPVIIGGIGGSIVQGIEEWFNNKVMTYALNKSSL